MASLVIVERMVNKTFLAGHAVLGAAVLFFALTVFTRLVARLAAVIRAAAPNVLGARVGMDLRLVGANAGKVGPHPHNPKSRQTRHAVASEMC